MRALRPVLLLLSLLVAPPAMAAPPEPCSDGRFLQTARLLPGSADAAFDAVILEGGNVAIASGCPPTAAKVTATKRATRVVAKWEACGTLQKVRFAGAINARGGTAACTRLRGVLKAKKQRPKRVDAERSSCGDGRVDEAGRETCDPPGTASCSSTCQAEGPIVAPLREWTWVPFGNATCANGTTTGIGVNLSDTSSRVLLYLQGGGACWDETTCYVSNFAANIEEGYGAAAFAKEKGGLSISLFDRDDEANPAKDYNFVYVPYCTGDVHFGVNPDAGYGGRPTRHVGYLNMTAFLERIVPTFPNAERVILSGASAGGFGALANWYQTQQAFGTIRVDLLDDSGAPLPNPYLPEHVEQRLKTAWKFTDAIPTTCVGCADDLHKAFDFYAAEFTGHRGAVLSYTHDAVISVFFEVPGATVAEGLAALHTALSAHDGYRVFYKTGTAHVVMFPDLDKLQNGVSARTFVTQMLTDDPAWASVLPPP